MNNQSQQRAAQRLKRRRMASTRRHMVIVAPHVVRAAEELAGVRGRSQNGVTVAAWRATRPAEAVA